MELVAFKPGFFLGARVRVGQAFSFDEKATVHAKDKAGRLAFDAEGKPVMIPLKMPTKWAAPSAEALKQIARDRAKQIAQAGDTKPVAARTAALRKTAASASDLA